VAVIRPFAELRGKQAGIPDIGNTPRSSMILPGYRASVFKVPKSRIAP
jgi:hypothetical protein